MKDENGVLSLEEVGQTFGTLQVLSGINMEFHKNSVTGIIGPNGAGKTTLFNIITGLYTPTTGKVIFEGTDITGIRPYLIARKGIARTFQNIRLFHGMSVMDNIIAGMCGMGRSTLLDAFLWRKRKKLEDSKFENRADELLKLMGLWEKRYSMSGSLPYGEQRRLEIARAMATGASVLLLDEPAAGMNDQETAQMDDVVHSLRELGYTILLIEHDMRFVMNNCEYIYVLDHGVQIAQGVPGEITKNPLVLEAYLGGEESDGSFEG